MTSFIKLTAGADTHLVSFSSRDWKAIDALCSRDLELDARASQLAEWRWMLLMGFGTHDESRLGRDDALASTEALFARVLAEGDAINWDYSVEPIPRGLGYQHGTRLATADVSRVTGQLRTYPGQCYAIAGAPAESGKWEASGITDLRHLRAIWCEGDLMRIKRRRHLTCWLTELPELIAFLRGVAMPELVAQTRARR